LARSVIAVLYDPPHVYQRVIVYLFKRGEENVSRKKSSSLLKVKFQGEENV